MKHLLLAILALGLLAGCKTTEANYRSAYDRAVAGRDSAMAFEQTIYGKHRRNVITREVVASTGDTVTMRAMMVVPAKGYEDVELKPYNVVVGEFKQLFNASSMCTRLRQGGYAGAFVVKNKEPYHYVILSTHNSAEEAVKALKSIKKLPVATKEPCPYVMTL